MPVGEIIALCDAINEINEEREKMLEEKYGNNERT